MNSFLKSVYNFDQGESFKADLFLLETRIAIILYRNNYLLIESVAGQEELFNSYASFLASLNPSLTIELKVQQLYNEWAENHFSFRFKRDASKYILVGVNGKYYQCIDLGRPIASFPADQLQAAMNAIDETLQPGETILNKQ
jgi:hypothetical protein